MGFRTSKAVFGDVGWLFRGSTGRFFWSKLFVSGDALPSLCASFAGAAKGGMHYIGSNMRSL